MGGETVTESWFGSLWRTSRDRQIVRLREEIVNSLGIRKFVSDNDDYLMDLALAEIIENLECLAKSVARLGKRYTDPVYHHLEHVFDDPIETDFNWCGWEYKLKKMERKVKKMERFVVVIAQLFQELEVLIQVSHSISARMHTSVHSSETNLSRFHSGPLGRPVSNSGMISNKIRSKKKQCQAHHHSSTFFDKPPLSSKTRGLAHVGPFKGCMTGGSESPGLLSCTLTSRGPLSLDARDDLYNRLPVSVRTSLREKLKLFSKTSASSIYDPALAADWSLALAKILEWLALLAHNMIRWHSERNYEEQRMVPMTNMLLIQTLHFANQVKTEAAIIELLMVLNYISKFGRGIDERALMESAGRSACVDSFLQRDNIIYGM
ncbi:type-1 restriction enzyme mjaxp r protein [Actinidia rufa]|uniref:Type-1 restriction enzyme mjaxp r protein n=1 Tax=Actinidia rufa TaxID=165716 RepID=A0A7J0GJ46_9ERIC|nr:type-1 restriction enzyme mjaxp r protein [Actinidia rufa]